ncbi:hypothetical protein GCM10027290_12050 [Micromonospora sonneratiae]|uniref:Uncharacterized protein n=1 Tax=Micromonospora sonneratiae TaxID=1184706 RepID=A0ABW3YGV2_9ACTN
MAADGWELNPDVEIARYDWQRLKSFKGDAAALPSAINALVFAESEESAEKAYWQIDNVALLQGRLSECVAPLVSRLVAGLLHACSSGRAYILDLLAAIADDYDDHVDIGHVGPVSVRDCAHRMVVQFSLHVDELRLAGNPSCVDILLMREIYEERLTVQVKQILDEALHLDSCANIIDLIETSLADLG